MKWSFSNQFFILLNEIFNLNSFSRFSSNS